MDKKYEEEVDKIIKKIAGTSKSRQSPDFQEKHYSSEKDILQNVTDRLDRIAIEVGDMGLVSKIKHDLIKPKDSGLTTYVKNYSKGLVSSVVEIVDFRMDANTPLSSEDDELLKKLKKVSKEVFGSTIICIHVKRISRVSIF